MHPPRLPIPLSFPTPRLAGVQCMTVFEARLLAFNSHAILAHVRRLDMGATAGHTIQLPGAAGHWWLSGTDQLERQWVQFGRDAVSEGYECSRCGAKMVGGWLCLDDG